MFSLSICDIEDENTWHLLKVYTHPEQPYVKPQVWWARKGTSPRGLPCWVNRNGGYYTDNGHITSLRTMQAESFWDLPQTDTTEYQKLLDVPQGCRLGWLSPEGAFHPCDYSNHDQYAHVVLDREVSDLEKENWARITGCDNDPLVQFGRLARYQGPTEEQAQFLLEKGY